MSPQRALLGRMRHLGAADETLLARAREGDSRAFEEVYRRSHDAVFGFCLLRLRDRQAAEDATQEVFIKAAEATTGAVADVNAWLFTIARNVVIDAGRRMKARPLLSPLLADDIGTIAGSADVTAMSALDVPSNVFIALRRLKSRERKALILREFQDRTSREIADEFAMTPGAVDVLLSRARAAFGVAYQQVTEMPFACRQTTESIYRDMGSGLSEDQRRRMDTHLKHCARCALEHRMARAPKMLGGLLGWPWMQQVAEALAHSRLAGLSLPVKAAVGATVMVLAVAPAAVRIPEAGIDPGAPSRQHTLHPSEALGSTGGMRTETGVMAKGRAPQPPVGQALDEQHRNPGIQHVDSEASHFEPTPHYREPTGEHAVMDTAYVEMSAGDEACATEDSTTVTASQDACDFTIASDTHEPLVHDATADSTVDAERR